jgi:hypothetical protein
VVLRTTKSPRTFAPGIRSFFGVNISKFLNEMKKVFMISNVSAINKVVKLVGFQRKDDIFGRLYIHSGIGDSKYTTNVVLHTTKSPRTFALGIRFFFGINILNF